MVVVPALAALGAQLPDLQVELMADPRSFDLPRRQAEIAVRLARPSEAELVCRKLGDYGFAHYASRDYISRNPTPDRGGSLAGHMSVTYLGAPGWFGKALIGTRAMLFSNSPFVQLRAIAEGIGIGFAPCCLGDAHPGVERLWPSEPPMLCTVWMIVHRDLRRVAKVRVVANAIAEAFERGRHVLRSGSHKSSTARTLVSHARL
jgi:DNA-binding transcriptional LysR family regulator